ncbi:tRNA dihydrouridine synthase [Craterilacuibacter sinensis]|uniref:tRNA-dihydrouridine(16) synthase n=1 Tax=Craterilacuibacter sinensis TaxID=2686017 RepID=A0A845BP66_9NEIS|nr:tRNA-dihydrouridine synthase [Craterilacuibacter sinensis]MXR37180.1 tRNA dihydrouridine(16) synthase DusC [Craterilacuibacter sinensis]RQW28919.1 tRNA dihydrouridine(16) synthase DusC [Rhodobacteraceae bacterium CH30]
MAIVLAPMEGIVDEVMRDVLTGIGGIDLCVSEFIRVTDTLLPLKTFQRHAPELFQSGHTRFGVPLRVQLLGSEPQALAHNALRLVEYGAKVVDLNFGCPAPTVNRHGGGAALLKQPDLMHEIVSTVRAALPETVLLTAKMRLGFEDTSLTLACAEALVSGGVGELTVHARTKVEGYRPPAHWEWLARIREHVSVPVVANGEVWTLDDYLAIREVSGCDTVMIGRGLLAAPDLARRIAHYHATGEKCPPASWAQAMVWVLDFYAQCRARGEGTPYPVSRIKQWLPQMKRSYPEAEALFAAIRKLTQAADIQTVLDAEIRR